MARANRHFIPGQVWHLTHRCHKREFLLKFTKDRVRWLYWLRQAKIRYGLCVLNYCVTCNHIHLLVQHTAPDVICHSMQLISGRTAQEYNQRKHRKGAYWEDRYHATAVATDHHLIRCLTYIDLNMVRAGVVNHPAQWPHCGFQEILNPPKRYRIVDVPRLMELCGISKFTHFQQHYHHWLETRMFTEKSPTREKFWTECIAVGNQNFVKDLKEKLGFRSYGRKILSTGDSYMLREPDSAYNVLFDL